MRRIIAGIGLIVLIGIFIIVPSLITYNSGGWQMVGLFWGIIAGAAALALAFDWCINNFE